MPRKSDKMKLGEHYDRRRKLTSEQKEEIKAIYKTGICSMKSLAEKYGVSKSMVCLIVNPTRAAKVAQRAKEHWRDYRPDNETWAATMREHRNYKHDLYLKGVLK